MLDPFLPDPFSRSIRHHALSMLEGELETLEATERARRLPGDELLVDARIHAAHSLTIDAPLEAIWPWLVQMVCRGTGLHASASFEDVDALSAPALAPEPPRIRVGDLLPATPGGDDVVEVLRIDPRRALVLGGLYDRDAGCQLPFDGLRPAHYWQVTWAFVLEPLGAAETRVFVRARVSSGPGRGAMVVAKVP